MNKSALLLLLFIGLLVITETTDAYYHWSLIRRRRRWNEQKQVTDAEFKEIEESDEKMTSLLE
uniref:Antimicrobial peptide n=1 Tax=Ciona intestinalis TaxID=7719 RepID=F6VGV1_CIOIN